MTENKKKRGRPPGSGKKKEETESEIINRQFRESMSPAKLLTANEITYPSNWNDMSKIAKLEWLTAHPRK